MLSSNKRSTAISGRVRFAIVPRRMPAIARLFPDAKVVACVRELPWVIDSIERLVQHNVFSPSSIFNYSAGGAVYTRAQSLGGPTVQAIYDFLGEPDFEYDFDRVDYDVTDFDERAGTSGLHAVRGTIKAEPRETMLPPELFKRFANDAFWRDSQRIPAGLQVV